MRKELTMERDIIDEFQKKFRKIRTKNTKGKQRQLTKVFSLLSDNIYNRKGLNKVENLFATKINNMDETETEMSRSTLKRIESNIEYRQWWIKTYYKEIERWLKGRGF